MKKYQCREVLRGKLAGTWVTLQRPDAHYPGFWWCSYEKDCGQAGFRPRDVLLNGEQLGPPRP